MAPNATMQALVYNGTPYNVTIANVSRPTIQNHTDAVVRITTSAICGSALHFYHGLMGGTPPCVVGHEAIGHVSAVGDAVSSLSVGDYVVIPDNAAAGHLEMVPEALNSFGGGTGLGGLQAEYARVPFADDSLIPVPLTHETTNSSVERDYLTTGDIFATGWSAIDYSGFQPGDTVAVFGAGATRNGGIGQIGVYMQQETSPAAPLGDSIPQNVSFAISDFFLKHLRYEAGIVDPKVLAPQLVELISAGRARPSFISTAEIRIDEVPRYYERFDRKENIKVYIHFP
ncbi:hypothetical protein SI65_04365 [Aspergillus cristatus]|uniref:Alcohol dehydrogenase-like N-terminal domain-containing protein n=1 Tax=Aspergillus cristatus TaxID=573508 RepID=A0A1E3BF18_ASPCR|nr:hypothetical protein SI65_04365 [Aspergillus cristatus]